MKFPLTIACYSGQYLESFTLDASDFDTLAAFQNAINEAKETVLSKHNLNSIVCEYSHVIDDFHYPTVGKRWDEIVFSLSQDAKQEPAQKTSIEVGDICYKYSKQHENFITSFASHIRGFSDTGVYHFHDAYWLDVDFSLLKINYTLTAIKNHLDAIECSPSAYGTFLMQSLGDDAKREELKALVSDKAYFTVFGNGYEFANLENLPLMLRGIYWLLMSNESFGIADELMQIHDSKSSKAEKIEQVRACLKSQDLLPDTLG